MAVEGIEGGQGRRDIFQLSVSVIWDGSMNFLSVSEVLGVNCLETSIQSREAKWKFSDISVIG